MSYNYDDEFDQELNHSENDEKEEKEENREDNDGEDEESTEIEGMEGMEETEEPRSDVEDFENVPSEEFVAPTIYAGKEHLRTWNPDAEGGIKTTTAEGILGKKQSAFQKKARTPEEKFRDNLERAANAKNAQIDSGTLKAVIQLIPKIPDIQYKNPTGCLLGYLFLPYLGKKLNPSEEKKADKIIKKTKTITEKRFQIFPLDVVRYARAWNLWLHGKAE